METFAIIFCGTLALISAIVILKLSQKKKPPAKSRKKSRKTKAPPVLTAAKPHARQAEIDALAKHNPEMVGHILKQWLNEESKKKSGPPTRKI